MKKYFIVRSSNKEWYVYISKTEGLSLTGCAEIAYKFLVMEDAEEKAKEINNNPLFKNYKMEVEVIE